MPVDPRSPQLDVPPATRTERSPPAWALEAHDADAVERAEVAQLPGRPGPGLAAGFGLGIAASVAGLLPALLPLSPGYSADDTAAKVVAAVVAGAVAVGIVPLASGVAARAKAGRDRGLGGVLLLGVALLSAGAAAIHFAVAKSHFEEYTLFGVLFLLSGVAQLGWALLVLFRPVRPVLLLGALGNVLIAAVWAVDRIWGLPIGPEHWKPEPVGFADSAASGFELLLAFGCLALLPRGLAQARARAPGRTALMLTLAVVTLTVLGLLSAIGVGSPAITPSA